MTTSSQQTHVDSVQAIAALMNNFTVEVTPKGAAKIADFREHLEPGTRVYVTALPGTDFGDTVETCKKLHNDGMHAIPHFTGRSLRSKDDLEERLRRVTGEANVSEVLAIAGADTTPQGPYPDSSSMIETGLFDKYGIKSIGIAGHPEGSPDIDKPLLREHGQRKIDYAGLTDTRLYMVTQFVFEAQPVIDWIERVRQEGNQLPLIVGLPGIASLKSLIGHAKACGVGASMKVLTRQAKNLHKLMSPQEPNQLVRELAEYAAANPQSNIAGVHVYPLGGLLPSAKWAYKVAEGHINLTDSGFETNK